MDGAGATFCRWKKYRGSLKNIRIKAKKKAAVRPKSRKRTRKNTILGTESGFPGKTSREKGKRRSAAFSLKATLKSAGSDLKGE